MQLLDVTQPTSPIRKVKEKNYPRSKEITTLKSCVSTPHDCLVLLENLAVRGDRRYFVTTAREYGWQYENNDV